MSILPNSQKMETTQMAINKRTDKWINLENIMLSEISQAQKNKYYMRLFIQGT
jgi:hypothetical protein